MCSEMREQVEATIEVIRPALQADGGDIVLRDVDADTGVVEVELVGACGTCPVATQTLKAGIERKLADPQEWAAPLRCDEEPYADISDVDQMIRELDR